MQIPIALGVAAATAVIVGALVVGDSVRTSLRELALDRLGKVDHVLIAPRFFDQSTLSKWMPGDSIDNEIGNKITNMMEGVILFPRSTVEKKTIDAETKVQSNDTTESGKAQSDKQSDSIRIAGGALCIGIEPSFWSLGDFADSPQIADDEAIVNMALAEELGVDVGDRISVRLPSLQAVPADSPLGKRDESTVSLTNLRVIAVLPNRSLARFDLRSNQRPARNVFVAKSAIQAVLDRPNQINAAFVSMPNATNKKQAALDTVAASDQADELLEKLPVTLADLGYAIKPVIRKFPDETIGEKANNNTSKSIIDYLQITSDQLLIQPDALAAIEQAIPLHDKSSNKQHRASVLAYLANGITRVTPATNEPADDLADEPADSKNPTAISNTIIPYSTIVGLDPESLKIPSIGFDTAGNADDLKLWIKGLQNDEVLINTWLAEQTESKPGDSLKIDYFVPETVDGTEVEKSIILRVAGIVPITEPSSGYRRNRSAKFSEPPTQFNDSEMVPKVPGITDQESMSDWDLPFALTRKIRDEDDKYWNNHRLTPKLYMSLSQSQKLFGSRFGSVSSIRIATNPEPMALATGDRATKSVQIAPEAGAYGSRGERQQQLEASLLTALKSTIKDLGWQVLPLRAQQIAASKGTTPFDALFLALSMFVIVSALLLVSLLFRLSIERRSTEWGLLKSIGIPAGRIQSILRFEGVLLSTIGSVVGVGLGVAYGYGVIGLLKSWWVGAVGTPFLDFHVKPQTLVIGSLIGIAMASLTTFVSGRFVNWQSPIALLKGIANEVSGKNSQRSTWFSRWSAIAGIVFWILPVATVGIGLFQTGPAAAGAFVGAGMLMLFGLVAVSYRIMKTAPAASNKSTDQSMIRMTLASLAINSVRRNPWRSVLAIGLMAVASFLILSISLFEASPDAAGTGGFDLMVQSTVAVPKNLGDSSYQRETLGDRSASLANTSIIPMRVRDGDDAGCSNLYQAAQPQVFGVSNRLRIWAEENASDSSKNKTPRADFAWAARGNVADNASPWILLETPGEGSAESPVPVILDQNTALWALHLTGTPGEEFHYEMGNQTVYFRTVAVLQNTILQGSLLIGESNFQSLFPEISGYRLWLVRDEAKTGDASINDLSTNDLVFRVEKIASALEGGWSDEGMDAASTRSILQNLLAVQNTYLKAFQSLGGLGLLLGTFGLVVVQMRSIQERRPELGLMKAIGWSESRLGKLLLLESFALLGWGMGIGVIAAFFAILPTLIQGAIPVGVITPALTLIVISLFGLLSGLVAVWYGTKVPMLAALRSE